ncbi:unnamed protein product [Sphagnum balticum]
MDVRRKWDGRPTEVGRTSDGSGTVVRRKWDGRPTEVGRRWWRYTITPRNVIAMAESVATRSVVTALLQQRAGRHNVAAMASNALDFAALLRWLAVRWTLRRVITMSSSVLGLGALLRCPTLL